MDGRLTEFSEILRQNGLRVGVSETVDAARAAAEVGLADRELFRATLQATLCKRAGDLETFDRAFDFYFSGAAKTFEGLDASLARRIAEEGLLEGDELTMIVAWLDQLRLQPLTEAALRGNTGQLANLLRNAALQLDFSRMQSPLQTGFFSRRMMVGAGVESMRSDLKAINAELQARGVSPQGLEVVARQLGDALRRVEEAARREVDRQAKARLRKPTGGLNDRPFHTLSRAEVERMQRAVRALAEKLKARLVRRQKSRKRGTLNPIRTLRKNLSAGGVPMQPVFRHRRPERPDVMVLCDVSDSVRNASRMMLLFTWTLQSLFSRVRSFVFVSEIGEATALFKNAEPEVAIDRAVSGETISVASNSNYGHALATFAREYLGSVTRRTTVLVIGDGRNNYNPANVWALEDLKRKARRVVWICTEPRASWGFGDSEMLQYSKACHQVVTVQTLGDLEQVAAQLVAR
ncbi:MAG: VWA domain-containing protein [Archangiaceae bacterium]|nr:VWA domain-containing protein [Archangiaceae bacterium]